MAGLTALTRMRCGPPSVTSCRVSASTPPLAAPCAFCGMKAAPRVAEIEAMLTIEPPPRATRCGQTSRVTRKTMSSSLRIVNDQSSTDSSVMGPKRMAEALLTSTSTPPCTATASATQAAAPASVARSTGAIAVISPPAARTSSTVSADPTGSRSHPTTRAPSRARTCAVARPMPPPVPVTSAIFPAIRTRSTSFR